jgi:hypothetical protein
MVPYKTTGLTIKELKEIINSWPEVDEYGEPYGVWVETGENLSGPVREVSRLNTNDIIFLYSSVD